MIARLGGKGLAVDGCNAPFAYGHALFWALYSIIGDGGSGSPDLMARQFPGGKVPAID